MITRERAIQRGIPIIMPHPNQHYGAGVAFSMNSPPGTKMPYPNQQYGAGFGDFVHGVNNFLQRSHLASSGLALAGLLGVPGALPASIATGALGYGKKPKRHRKKKSGRHKKK